MTAATPTTISPWAPSIPTRSSASSTKSSSSNGKPVRRADIAYMIDQSHNLKGKIEATIQTVVFAQELFAKAALVDHAALAIKQAQASLVEAEECLRDAFSTDVRPLLREWRRSRTLAEDPMRVFRESGYLERVTRERGERNAVAVTSYA